MTQVYNGKSFEFALASQIRDITGAKIIPNSASNTAEKYYSDNRQRHHMDIASN